MEPLSNRASPHFSIQNKLIMTKLLKIGFPLLLIGGIIAYIATQPKPPLDIHSATTELTVNATGLYADFEDDETAANATYAGKVMEVSGVLSGVEQNDAGGYVLSLEAGSPLGHVICNLPANEKLPVTSASINRIMKVKGVCTGYLFDVVLDNATIISQ